MIRMEGEFPMKNHESAGFVCGSLLGAAAAAAAVYLTGSAWSALLAPACCLLGGRIGRDIPAGKR